jgi:hypothetical protein
VDLLSRFLVIAGELGEVFRQRSTTSTPAARRASRRRSWNSSRGTSAARLRPTRKRLTESVDSSQA